MKNERYIKKFNEETDVNEIIGFLKGKYNTISQVKSCPKFKQLSQADKDYVIDELKADKFKESKISIGQRQQDRIKQIVLKTLRKYKSNTPFRPLYIEIIDSINNGDLKWNVDSDIENYILDEITS